MLSKKIIIPMAAVAFVAAGTFGVAQVSATGSNTTVQGSLAQKLADAFHLDKAKVQAVINQNRQDNQAARETKYEDRLSRAVTDKKLTAAQKSLVLSEHQKLVSETQSAMSGTSADRRSAMQKIRTEAQDWVKANNIAMSWLMGGNFSERGKFHHQDADSETTPAPTPAASS